MNSRDYNYLHDLSVSPPSKLISQEKQKHICVSVCVQQLNFLSNVTQLWKHLVYLCCKWHEQKTNMPFEKCVPQTHPLFLESSLLKSSVMNTDAQLALLDSHVLKHLRHTHKIPLSTAFFDLDPRSLCQHLSKCLASVSWSIPSSVSI